MEPTKQFTLFRYDVELFPSSILVLLAASIGIACLYAFMTSRRYDRPADKKPEVGDLVDQYIGNTSQGRIVDEFEFMSMEDL